MCASNELNVNWFELTIQYRMLYFSIHIPCAVYIRSLVYRDHSYLYYTTTIYFTESAKDRRMMATINSDQLEKCQRQTHIKETYLVHARARILWVVRRQRVHENTII